MLSKFCRTVMLLLLVPLLGACGNSVTTCMTVTDCTDGQFCVSERCQQCRSGRDCRPGQHCVNGRCNAISDNDLLE
jgi:hypothetical protein